MNTKTTIATVLACGCAFGLAAADIGEELEAQLAQRSFELFGFEAPLQASSGQSDVVERESAAAAQRQRLAGELTASFVARNVGFRTGTISFWPDDVNYSHLIVCSEGERTDSGVGRVFDGNVPAGQNSSVQRVSVTTGRVETILHGLSRCDDVRTTQWGSVLASEKGAEGAAYEIIDPLGTDAHWVADRATGDVRDGINSSAQSTTVAKRSALATQAWAGLEVLDNGVVIAGDELRPTAGNDGGAVYRFVPDAFYTCAGAPVRPGLLCGNPITDLAQSPLVSGQNYALFHSCGDSFDYGQGCEFGDGGRWVAVSAATARADANANGATGYCRPEDLQIDRSFGLFSGGEGIRWCWNNNCGGSDGEAVCATESSAAISARDQVVLDIGGDAGAQSFLSTDGVALAQVDTAPFVSGGNAALPLRISDHNSLDIQPFTGNTYITEDTQFGDVWGCLPDGGDSNEQTDGCVALLSVTDPLAVPSGFTFDGTGLVAFYSLQQGSQSASLLDAESNFACDDGGCNGYTDDLIRLVGFQPNETFPAAAPPNVALSGTVFTDVNGNGFDELSEPGVVGVRVTAFLCTPPFGVAGTAVSEGVDGTFSIADLAAGEYQIGVDLVGRTPTILQESIAGGNDLYPNGFTNCVDVPGEPVTVGFN